MRRWLAVLIVASVLPAGCTSARSSPIPAPVAVSWREVRLPADPRGRVELRDVASCAGHWYAAGALLTPSGGTLPALWSSVDGTQWTAVAPKPVSAYGPSHVLYSVSCDGETVVTVGASNGGAHGNPRTGTWYAPVGGATLTEVPSGFEQYGGLNAIGVGPVSGGGAGWVIVGARINANGTQGAAVWQSHDGHTFTLIDDDPALESDKRGVTEADGALVTSSGYLAVGGITPPGSVGSARDAIAWRSSDGRRWERLTLSAEPGDDLLQRVTATPTGVLAVGPDPTGFSVWTADASGQSWRRAGHFGGVGGGTAVPAVSSLVSAGTPGVDYAVVSDSATYGLWRGTSGTDWRQVTLPVSVLAAPVRAGPRVVRVAADSGNLLLVTNDGTDSRLWLAPAPPS